MTLPSHPRISELLICFSSWECIQKESPPRCRRYDRIEYLCGSRSLCTKSYCISNHLHAHTVMLRHEGIRALAGIHDVVCD